MKNILTLAIIFFSVAAMAQTKKLMVEPNHSSIGFSISIAGFTKVTGKFTDYKVALDWNENHLDSCSISAIIQVESINTGIADRDAHLRTADFFDTEKYPEITFQSDSIKQINYSNFEVYGKLSMHGVTNNFVLPFHIVKIENNTIGISSKSELNRKDFGVGSTFNHSSMPDFLSDIIELEFHLWTKKRKD